MIKPQHKIISGVNSLLIPMPDHQSVTILVLVKAGSIYEPKEKNGISHFLEHMFFKGGEKYPTPKSVVETIDEIGGEMNAYTGEEYAGYYIKAAPQHLEVSFSVLSDMLLHSKFPEEEIGKEKNVVIQELKMYEDMPQRQVSQLRNHRYYGDTPFGRPIIGNEETIHSFSQQQLFDRKENLYTKDNSVVIVAGNRSSDQQVEDLIAQSFAGLGERRKIHEPAFFHELPVMHESSTSKKTQQNHIIMGAKGFSLFEQEKYAARLVGKILGGTMSSRLFQEVREKRGLCYYVSAGHFTSSSDGLFQIRAGIEKERRSEGKEAILRELDEISKGNITQQEHQKALGNTLGGIGMGFETTDEVADFFGSQFLLQNKLEPLEALVDHYQKVTLEQLNHTAKLLSPENVYSYFIE